MINYRDFVGKVLVILPIKGSDYSIEENIKSVIEQREVDFKLVVVFDDENESEIPLIKKLNLNYIITDRNLKKGSGKVRAITTALKIFKDYDAYVVVDSDVQVEKGWLKNLIRPLSDDKIGASTTFPYFKGVSGLWSKIKTLWGFVGMSMMESKITRFCWGGSMAFKKELINDSIEYFASSVSDDMAITELCARKNYNIEYCPDAVAIVNSPDNFNVFSEWSVRQTALMISRRRKYIIYGIGIYLSFIFLFWEGLFLGIFYNHLFFIFLIPFILSEIRTFGRLKDKDAVYFFLQFILPYIYCVNIAIASKKRTITWRGSKYDLY
ncbi:glycosyltransferase [Caldiplasma sukawensis]